jgi:hypothetical protein
MMDAEAIVERYVQEMRDAEDMRVYAVWQVGFSFDLAGVYAGPGTTVEDELSQHAPVGRITYKACRSITIANKVYRQECDRIGSVERPTPRFWGCY